MNYKKREALKLLLVVVGIILILIHALAMVYPNSSMVNNANDLWVMLISGTASGLAVGTIIGMVFFVITKIDQDKN